MYCPAQQDEKLWKKEGKTFNVHLVSALTDSANRFRNGVFIFEKININRGIAKYI